jgi:2-hydroxychromene-2-carboxylate isomerase
VPPTAGSSTAEQPRFYYDLASPESYFAAERALHAVGAVPEWIPVSIGEPAFRCAAEIDAYREDAERRAAALGLMPLRWPDPFPPDAEWAMLVATFAKQIGRAVAFSLAAFRQAYAAGRDLGDPDTVMLAAAACEMHPAAIDKGAGRDSIRRRLQEATDAAGAAGVLEVPAVQVGDRIFHGDRELEAAAAVLA